MTVQDMDRIAKELKMDGIEQTELGRRMIYLKPSAEMIGNLLREKKSNNRQLAALGIVCVVALFWLVSR